MRILAIHGIGHCDAQTDWQRSWAGAITQGLQRWNPALQPDIEYLRYDDLFEQHALDTAVVARALGELVSSGLFFSLKDLVMGRRGLVSDALESVRWTAGMVAQWVALEDLRNQLRRRLAASVRDCQPDVIAAHSLGTLILYDTLRSDEVATSTSPLSANRTVITFGSQIGNPAVRRVFGGRIAPLEDVRFWWHLFNAEDEVFTAPLVMPGKDRFRQVDTLFNVKGIDHDGALYLRHTGAVSAVWQDLASRTRALGVPAVRARGAASTAPVSRATALSAKLTKARQAKSRPQMRALLVGIADYQDQSNNLEGPVNDVFNMSATLQELGFDADDIRIVLNDRATAAGIRERLKWLLADPRDGDQRVFFFAGHGAQIPGYGSSAEVDRLDECLVPYDFDWGQGRAITDDEFAALYSQLPYGTQFTAVLDCCHSGGIARAGGVRPRGITPPDDIRHRSICWDKETQMWLPRERFEKKKIGAKQGATGRGVKRAADRQAWVGESGAVQRLGRGTSLWLPSDSAYRRARKRNGHAGPYTPILLEACAEGELAYEYRHGVVSHGAFTFALCGALRDAVRRRDEAVRRKRKPTLMTFAALRDEVATRIGGVVTEPQHPQLNCAKVRLRQSIPGLA